MKQTIKWTEGELLYWLDWLKTLAVEHGIWTGKNDDIIYEEIVQIVKKSGK